MNMDLFLEVPYSVDTSNIPQNIGKFYNICHNLLSIRVKFNSSKTGKTIIQIFLFKWMSLLILMFFIDKVT